MVETNRIAPLGAGSSVIETNLRQKKRRQQEENDKKRVDDSKSRDAELHSKKSRESDKKQKGVDCYA